MVVRFRFHGDKSGEEKKIKTQANYHEYGKLEFYLESKNPQTKLCAKV